MKSKDLILLEKAYKSIAEATTTFPQEEIKKTHALGYVAKVDEHDDELYNLSDKYKEALRVSQGKVGKIITTHREDNNKVFKDKTSGNSMVYSIEFADGSTYDIFNDFVWHPTAKQIQQYDREIMYHKLTKKLPELKGIFDV